MNRIVHIECRTARLYSQFRAQLTYMASPIAREIPGEGFEVIDEERWAARLSAYEGKEIPSPASHKGTRT